MKLKIFYFVLLVFLNLGNFLTAQELQPIPTLKERVTDLSGILSFEEKNILTEKLKAHEEQTTNQIAILILPTTEPEAIEQYSMRVVEAWKLGEKGKDNGVLLLFAMRDRKVRIEVGYGLEAMLPDAVCSRIIREVIVPKFKEKKYFEGIEQGLDFILQILNGEEFTFNPQTSPQKSSEDEDILKNIFINFFISFLLATWIRRGFSGSWVSEIFLLLLISGLIGYFFFSAIVIYLVASFILYLFILLVSKFNSSSGYYSSGGLDTGSFSDSGSTFSGLGGLFGGGGASGSWD